MSFHTQREPPRPAAADPLMPADHGPGDPVVRGVLRTLVERLVETGGAIRPSERTGYVVPFDPEVFKLTALDLLDEAGVQFLFHALATGVVGDGEVAGVVFDTKSGPVVIERGGGGVREEDGRDHGITSPTYTPPSPEPC